MALLVHERLICVAPAAVASRPEGAAGGPAVMAVAGVEGKVWLWAVGPPPTLVTVAKFAQPDPAQRWTEYPVTPILSVDPVQDRLTWVGPVAKAVKLDGAVGGVVSALAVLKVAICMNQLETPVALPLAAYDTATLTALSSTILTRLHDSAWNPVPGVIPTES